ncbi:MAG: hypothetical protein JWQ42_3555 [Edaphobacter sp.]|nr:hypothetical protein [Edaphobacter sp.]
MVLPRTSAEVGNYDAGLEEVTSSAIGQDVVDLEIVLRIQHIGLRATAGEGTIDDDPGCIRDAAHRVMVLLQEELKLIQQTGEKARVSFMKRSSSRNCELTPVPAKTTPPVP